MLHSLFGRFHALVPLTRLSASGTRGFTLLELIIVIAILAVLSVAVVLVINPAETLRQARDTTRLSDIGSLKSSLALYVTSVTPADMDGPTATETCITDVFISLARDATGTGQPVTDVVVAGVTDTLLTGTVAGADVVSKVILTNRNIGANGWMPVDLTTISGGSPFAALPIDPTNNPTGDTPPAGGASTAAAVTADALMYTYDCDGTNLTFELNTNMESGRYASGGAENRESTDGGDVAELYETGTDPSFDLTPTW